MNWLFVSPHLDDAVYSCGGLIWQRSSSGDKVGVWTICAGDAPDAQLSAYAESIHRRWGFGLDSTAKRRNEDIRSCRILNVSYRHYSIPDAIYRTGIVSKSAENTTKPAYLYQDEGQLFGTLHPGEEILIHSISEQLQLDLEKLPGFPKIKIVCPLGLGNHVDHQLTRIALQRLETQIMYYADFPYVLDKLEKLDEMRSIGWQSTLYEIDWQALDKWQSAAAAHNSQISTFWENESELYTTLEFYRNLSGGIELWLPPAPVSV